MEGEYAAVAAEYNERGFAVVRGFMPPDELAESLARLDDYWRQVLPRMPTTRAFFSDNDDLQSVRMIDFGGSPQAAPELGTHDH